MCISRASWLAPRSPIQAHDVVAGLEITLERAAIVRRLDPPAIDGDVRAAVFASQPYEQRAPWQRRSAARTLEDSQTHVTDAIMARCHV